MITILSIKPANSMVEIETSEGFTQYLSTEDLGGLRVANEGFFIADKETSEAAGELIEYQITAAQVDELKAALGT